MKISKDAQPVIVKRDLDNNLSFLVIKRFDKDKQEDHYRLVKGGIDAGETAEQAARRESLEEVGLKNILESKELDKYEYTAGDIKHEVEAFILIAGEESDELSPDSSNEGGFTIKEALWLSRDEALEKLNFEVERKMIDKAWKKLAA